MALGAGLHFGWPSPSIPKLLDKDLQFEVSSDEISYITAIAPFGYIIGSPICAILLDLIGRKKTLLLLAIPQILAWILIATSTCVPMLCLARLISGIAEGSIFTTLPVYLCEVSEPKIRGILGTTLTVGMIFGIVLINCYGSYLPITTTAYISIAIPLLFVLTFTWMPESPYFYLVKGQIKNARKSLQSLRRMHDVEEELNKLIADVQRQLSEPGSLKDIFTIKSNLTAFFVVMGLRTLQQFSGVSSFSMYTQVIFQQAGGGISPAESSIIYSITQFSITFCGSLLIDRFGRKPMIIASSAGSAVFLFIEGLYFYFHQCHYNLSYFNWVPITGMMMYIIVNSVGIAVGPNLVMGELFSASIKAKALGIMNIYFALCLSCSVKLFHYLDYNYGMHVPFFFFGFSCVLGVIFSYFCIPETKGKSLEEIQQILKGNISLNRNVPPDKREDEVISTKC